VCITIAKKNKNYKPLIKHHEPTYIALVVGIV
jgi:hypothetical protein